MFEMDCPWCEATLAVDGNAEAGQCPECLTSWVYEDDVDALPLAA